MGTTIVKVIGLMNWWPNSRSKPHLVMDSGYGSFGLMDAIANWGGVATISLPSNECQGLHSILSYNLPLNHWRALVNDKGYVFSVQCKLVENATGSTSIAKKYVLSNAFKAVFLNSTTVNLLGSNTAMPRFTREELIKFPCGKALTEIEKRNGCQKVTLRSICEKYNIKTGKNKDGTIGNILTRTKALYENVNEVEQVEKFLKTQFYTGTSPVNKQYVDRFNAVDLGDRLFAKTDDGHRTHDWHAKLFRAILRLGMVNTYIRYVCASQYVDWIDFRRTLGIALVG